MAAFTCTLRCGIDEALRPELLDISSAIRNRLTLARMRRVLDFEG